MLGTLSAYAPTSAPRRVEPPGSALRLTEAPEAAAPPRQAVSDTDEAALAALARSGAEPGAPRVSSEGALAAQVARAAIESAEEPATSDAEGAEEEPAAGLTDAELEAVARLADRDREVRSQEMAQVIAGRPWAGPPVYMYQMGPDGRRYAIGGFVPIDVSPVEGDPQATASKMRVVSDAALVSPGASAADRRVAAIAQAKLQEALAAISSQSAEARKAISGDAPEADAPGGLNVRI